MPRRELQHLGAEAVLAIHAEVRAAHGGMAGLRDRGLLESAVAAPQASFGGKPLIGDPVEVAAAYLFYLCRNHPFMDGNKRTALAAALVFLQVNGRLPDAGLPQRNMDDWEALVLEIAASKVDRAGATKGLRKLLKG